MKFLLLILLLNASGCASDDTHNDPGPNEEQLYVNGRIYTVNENQPWAEAMLVKAGIIIAIGSTESVEAQASENAEKIDLEGHMILPGIHDVHVHPLEAASENFQFSLSPEETDPENYVGAISQAVQNAQGGWVLGWGFDVYTLLDAQRPPIDILDDISTTKPIVIMEQTSHAVWVNSKALAMAGIDSSTPNPTGGVIMKDENGNPNGMLFDNAGDLVVDQAIAAIPNSEQQDYEGLVYYSLPELAKNGITSVCDARVYWKRNYHQTWQRVADEGKLIARVNLGLWVYPTEDDATQIASLQSMYRNDANSLLKINQIKLYADGIVINTTSAMEEDYLIDLFELPTNNGLNYINESRIAQYISALEPTGFDFHIHAIGNRGVKEALNAIEQSAGPQGRHRLTHLEYINPSDYTRFAQLNVTADVQVAGHFTNPSEWHEFDELVDPALNDAIIPIKSLQQADARITLSSDWDVSTLNPFVGMQHAVTRAPQELSLAEAIKAYTINAAYVMRQENTVGSLEVGKEADFVVIDQNIFDIPANEIGQTRVLETYLQGRLVFNR